jgi:molecular chaperone DnaK
MPVIDKPIGIDLGTTNSAVAIMSMTDNAIEVYRDRFGRLTTPSCVAINPRTSKIIIGREAYNYRGNPNMPEPIVSIKRRMGFPDPVRLGDQEKTPIEISALILSELKRQIEEHLAAQGQFSVKRAVITVPAYFNHDQKVATLEAGKEAGLEVLELLAEPTAAAMYNAWLDNTQDSVYLVYDLGGGTFDVSVIRKLGREFTTLGTGGNNFLGGDDLAAPE